MAVALANSVFFSLPVGQAQIKVALYLALTMAPLAVAGPLMAPLLDRGGFRRAISFAAAAGRAVVAIFAAPRVASLELFPHAFVLLVLSMVHGITKNGLTMAYAPSHEGLVQANGRLGRIGPAQQLGGRGSNASPRLRAQYGVVASRGRARRLQPAAPERRAR